VVSRFGVFVIETKNMSGWIFGAADQSNWTQVLYKVKYRFQNPLRQNYRHVQTIKDQLGLSANQVNNCVVFLEGCEFKTQVPTGVALGTSQLVEFIQQKTVRVLSNQEVEQVVRDIESIRMPQSPKTDRIHRQNLKKSTHHRMERQKSRCPRCGSTLIERTNSRTGESFMGCSNYPQCRGTRPK
jgi:uncharacterized paraquat-inducible protein A